MTDSQLRAYPTASGGYAVHIPRPHGAETVLQYHPERGVWCSGTGHRDDSAEPACTELVDGLVEQPADEQDAARIVSEWIKGER